MNLFIQMMVVVVAVTALSIAGVSAYDAIKLNNMKREAQPCGFEAEDYRQECVCDGEIFSSEDTLNPSLAENIGGVNYYCYGRCSECVCFDADDNKVDCESI
ncbi:hypothetical protein GF351_02135 [Candidatus Woesearchaeota archaeon]|nr:hypothetical protein [Candidatus Woesearchaeota archaeon]